MNTKFSKGKWSQRKLFDSAIMVKDDNGIEWYHNSISIIDETGRVICELDYSTDHEQQGWGHNNNIELWEANAKLIINASEMFECLLEFDKWNKSHLKEDKSLALKLLHRVIKKVID